MKISIFPFIKSHRLMPDIRLELVVFIVFKKGNCCRVVHTRLNKEQALLPKEIRKKIKSPHLSATLVCYVVWNSTPFSSALSPCLIDTKKTSTKNIWVKTFSVLLPEKTQHKKPTNKEKKKKHTKKIHASFSKFLKCFYSNLITILSIKTFCSFVRVTSPRGKEKKKRVGREVEAKGRQVLKKRENKKKTKTWSQEAFPLAVKDAPKWSVWSRNEISLKFIKSDTISPILQFWLRQNCHWRQWKLCLYEKVRTDFRTGT